MGKAKKGLLGAAMAFASSPQGRAKIAQAKEFVQRPENQAKARKLVADVQGKVAGRRKGQQLPPG